MSQPRVTSTSVHLRDLFFDSLPADLRDKMAGHQARAEAWIMHVRRPAHRLNPGASDQVAPRAGAVSIHDVTDGGAIATRPGSTFVLNGHTRPEMGSVPLSVRIQIPGQPTVSVPVRPDGSWSASIPVPLAVRNGDLAVSVQVPTTTHGETYAIAGVDVGSALVSLQADDTFFSKTLVLTRARGASIDLAQVRNPELRAALGAYDTVADGVIDAQDLGGGAHAEATVERWSKFANGEARFRDASAALAIAALEAAPKPITGAVMREAILRGTGDLDGRGASVEFEAFDAFVREHFGPAYFTDEAAAVFLAYRNLAADAQSQGRPGLHPGLLRDALNRWSPGG